jgi:ribosomal subunit interface protein
MHTSVTFKNIDPSDNLRAYVEDKLDRFDRFLDSPAEANVVLSVEKFRHIAEINIIGRKLNIVGKEETNDMYSAIDMVLDKIGKQLKKNKEKIRDRRGGAKIGEFAAENINLEEAGESKSWLKILNINLWMWMKPSCRWIWSQIIFWFFPTRKPIRLMCFIVVKMEI